MIRVETTTYGAAALTKLGEVVAALKGDDPMTSVTILAPNNIAGIVARRHLAKGGLGMPGVAGIEVSTLPRLAERLAAHTLSPRRPATSPVVAAGWRRALTASPGVFAEVANHPATVRALSAAHRELRDLTDTALASIATTTEISPDLVRLHRQVAGQLTEDWYDATDLLKAASAHVGEAGFGTPVIIYLPQALTQAEAAFARALGQTSEVVVVAGLTGAERADSAIRRSLERMGGEAGPKPLIATAGRVLNASDSDDEIRCVVRDLVETLKSTPASRVAILYASPAPYSRLLHEHLTSAGVTVNGPGTRAVNERAVARTLLEVLALVDHDLPRSNLFRALSNAPTRDFTGTRIPLSRWERTSRTAGVVRGTDWQQRLDTYADGALKDAVREEANGERQWLADRHRDSAATAHALRDFACGLRDELERARSMTSWRDLASWCLDLFTRLIGEGPALLKLPAEEQYAAAAVTMLLRSLDVLDAVDGSASLQTLRDVLDLELTASLPRTGKFGDGVLVAPLSAAVGLDLDVLYVVGLSEDVYPGRLREDALLPERARSVIPDEIPGQREALHAKYRHLLVAFASAGEVVAAFPRGDLRRSSHRLPSRWLLGSLRELSGDHSLAATEWQESETYGEGLTTSGSFAGELLSTVRLATPQEWRTRQAMTGRLADAAVAAAEGMLRSRGEETLSRFDGNLAGVDGLPDFAQGDRLVSPTQLESYASCPHAYFVERLLGVKPLEQPEDVLAISPMDIGNLIHECMDDLVAEFADNLPDHGQPWSLEHRSRLAEIAEAKAIDFQERGLTGHPRLWERERLRITTDLNAMLDDDDEWRSARDARVVASEMLFGIEGTPAVEVVIPSGRVLMRGSVDKVDQARNGALYVTDIKTGGQRRFKGITQDDPVVGGTKLQLPIYAYAARERYGDRATPVSTIYWFVRRDAGRIGIELTPEVEAQYADTLDVLVRSIAAGLFPAKAPEAPDFAWVQCDFCNPDGIGHAETRERWLRKRRDPELSELVRLIDADAIPEGDDA
jgi:ATP-dependent helicase/nuclease subunit B